MRVDSFHPSFSCTRTLIDIKFPTSPWTYFVVPVTAELVSVCSDRASISAFVIASPVGYFLLSSLALTRSPAAVRVLPIRSTIVSKVRSGLPRSVLRDVTEQAMLNLVPLAGARREVAHVDAQTRFVSELLQSVLPGTRAIPVAPARIGGDETTPEPRGSDTCPSSSTTGVARPQQTPACRGHARRSPTLRCEPCHRCRRESPCPWNLWENHGSVIARALPFGCHSRPPFLNSPTSSFFFVSTETTG